MMSRELDGHIQQALNSLPADFRMTVILSDIEGMSYEEVSEAMKCSLGTVRSRLHRGRKQLRDKIVAFEKGQAALAKKERLTSASAAPTAKPVSLSAARSSHE